MAANESFLENAVSRGADIELKTLPWEANPGSVFEGELEWLKWRGSIAKDGTKMISPY